MFSIISAEGGISETFSRFLISSEKSLLRQSYFLPNKIQKHGWGLACFKAQKPSVVKSPNPIFEEKLKLDSFSRKISGNMAMAHIRDASNPNKLPIKKLLSEINTQPFNNENMIFCHNGTLLIADEIKQNLGYLAQNVKGNNDSEVLFWHIVKSIKAYGDIPTGLRMAADEINTVWISVKKDYFKKGIKQPYKGLNVMIADKNNLYAMCLNDSPKEKKAIMTKNWQWGDLALRVSNKQAVISSEPLDLGIWTKITPGQILTVFVKNKKLSVKKEKI